MLRHEVDTNDFNLDIESEIGSNNSRQYMRKLPDRHSSLRNRTIKLNNILPSYDSPVKRKSSLTIRHETTHDSPPKINKDDRGMSHVGSFTLMNVNSPNSLEIPNMHSVPSEQTRSYHQGQLPALTINYNNHRPHMSQHHIGSMIPMKERRLSQPGRNYLNDSRGGSQTTENSFFLLSKDQISDTTHFKHKEMYSRGFDSEHKINPQTEGYDS